MKIHSLITPILILASIACVSTAYLQAGYWLIIPILLATIILWISLKRWSIFWKASSLLLIYIFLAGIGLAIHLPVALIAIGCTCALAGWDMVNFNRDISDNQLTKYNMPLVKNHLQSLAALVGFSLLLIFLSSSINLHFPFGVVVFLALLAMGSLIYSVQYIKKSVGKLDESTQNTSFRP